MLKNGLARLFILGFLFSSFACLGAFNTNECKQRLLKVSQGLLDEAVDNPKLRAFLRTSSDAHEEDLISLCDEILLYSRDLGEGANEIRNIKDDLIKYLRSFTATGMDLGEVDPNFALIYDEQNPNFEVTFKNPAGEVRTRRYALKIWSVGLKVEIAIKVVGISIIGSGFNYYDTNKELKLSSGVDLGFDLSANFPLGFSLVLVGIPGTGCKLLMLGLDFGLIVGLSYVFGGEMSPIIG